jgi:hypothetical protein
VSGRVYLSAIIPTPNPFPSPINGRREGERGADQDDYPIQNNLKPGQIIEIGKRLDQIIQILPLLPQYNKPFRRLFLESFRTVMLSENSPNLFL